MRLFVWARQFEIWYNFRQSASASVLFLYLVHVMMYLKKSISTQVGFGNGSRVLIFWSHASVSLRSIQPPSPPECTILGFKYYLIFIFWYYYRSQSMKVAMTPIRNAKAVVSVQRKSWNAFAEPQSMEETALKLTGLQWSAVRRHCLLGCALYPLVDVTW